MWIIIGVAHYAKFIPFRIIYHGYIYIHMYKSIHSYKQIFVRETISDLLTFCAQKTRVSYL